MKKIMKLICPSIDINGKIYFRYQVFHFFYLKGWKRFASYLSYRLYRKYNCIISPSATIGSGFHLPHPLGIVIGEGVVIGKNVTIYQNVTLGLRQRNHGGYPRIDDNVIIYCNSAVLGDIVVGKNSIIGCNSTVLKNVGNDQVVFGIVKEKKYHESN